jgi:hypothetical protein
LEAKLFEPLKPNYLKFSDSIAHKEDIKKLFDESEEIKTAFAAIQPTPLMNGGNSKLPLLNNCPKAKPMCLIYTINSLQSR